MSNPLNNLPKTTKIKKIPQILRISEDQAQLIQSQIFLSDYYTVIKEVFENSLDAGSKNIKIYVCTETGKADGIEIRISDDGSGIENLEDIGFDCSSKLETSKIQSNVCDILKETTNFTENCEFTKSPLENNNTLGFRGRALASLALQSDLLIISKAINNTTAFSYDFNKKELKEMNRENGTTVEIKNLFKNCNIRKQKGINICKVVELIKPYLLIFDIHATVYLNNKIKFAGSMMNTVLGSSRHMTSSDVLKIEDNLFDIRFFDKTGFSKTFFDKKTSYFFANKHPIENKKLFDLINKQYLTFHPKLPFIVCFLKGNHKMYGVLKNQIKLSEEFLRDFEIKIREKLKIEILNIESSTLLDFKFYKKDSVNIPEFLRIKETNSSENSEPSLKKNKGHNIAVTPNSSFMNPMDFTAQEMLSDVITNTNDNSIDLSSQLFEDEIINEFELSNPNNNIFASVKQPSSFNDEKHNSKILNSTGRINISKYSFSAMNVIGQFNSGFILVSYLNLLIIIDQHAADEIFSYESIVEKFSSKRNVLFMPLKLPDNLIFDLTEVKLSLLRNYGFIIRKNLLTEVPCYKDIKFGVEEVEEILSTGFCSKIHDLCASNACRSSVMIGDKLNLQKMEKIVKSLSTLKEPWKCPHGRPVFLILKETRGEILQ